ncbi:Ig domain-containing protein [Burkholderia ubonensis]|uniref:Ig domain-containing protein n=1 Tax=Burkholderia ubonensis TaxID=101571 RepID=UPI000AB9BEC6|nr:Ig domain-containing protein [Burkholderia ubonensis]
MKKLILAAALAALAAPAFASDYYVVIPVPNRTATAGNILVTLNPFALPGGLVGRAYPGFDFNSVLQVKGDPGFNPGSVRWSVVGGALPAGMTLSQDGKLTGMPTAAATAAFQVMATYKTKAGQQGYQVVVGEVSVALSDATLPDGVQGAAYSYDFRPRLVTNDSQFNEAAVTWSVTGTLPPGLALNSNGTLTGTPSAEGTYPFTINASYLAKTGQHTYQVAVGSITVNLASASLPAVKVGDSYSFDLKPMVTVSGDAAYAGNGAGVTWSLASGTLPTGVYLTATGVIAGTPTVTGLQTFTAKAAYKSKTAQMDYALQVNPRGLALQAGGYRTWDDGTLAASCKNYRNGVGNYAYMGDTGSGVYRIQPSGWSATNVYCDMTTDGGGWTLAAWNKGNAGLANMPPDFFVKQVNAANVASRSLANTASSINVEGLSKALTTNDVMLVSAAYNSGSPIIERGQGVWSYDQPDCIGPIGHTGRNSGCTNHYGNDNWDTADRFNIAIYPGDTAIVPGWLNMGYEVCWSGRGWCDFEFYLR